MSYEAVITYFLGEIARKLANSREMIWYIIKTNMFITRTLSVSMYYSDWNIP
ncbi:hypothetical protein CHU_3443 [Cytophaga hutchinsonii ATCC 33406]|uniref:Uncharacterized protein n=1 Tax=Cytophaga hutchinsonii (strain ATCC 33406 / DSM 1761 / CIP 103989 / NBRC 15051 / NCIMB 9469 / D465) TaxID=269798 RepID=A0A6N4SVT0_CYTH3|nr:hypothetical protein CHU_3443 [Cytophaga hutchinsonii ATCC 33406]SFX69364.1 hypothetical protein SAMN04487930_1083 [Cytophaga hutchinsonii ATCC 33406]